MREETDFKISRDISEGLNQIILESISKIDEGIAQENYAVSFRLLSQIVSKISFYDFSQKNDLVAYTQLLNKKFNIVNSKPSNQQEKEYILRESENLKALILQYQELVYNSLDILGLWFKITKKNEDIDSKISKETFLTNEKLLEHKKEELSKLKSKELLTYFSPNHIHTAHSRYLITKSLQENK